MPELKKDQQEDCEPIEGKARVKSIVNFMKDMLPEIFKIGMQAIFAFIIASYTASYVTDNINKQRLASISADNIRNRNNNAILLFHSVRVNPVEECINNHGQFSFDSFKKINAQVQEYLVGLLTYGTGEIRDAAYNLFYKTADIEERMLNLYLFSINQSGEIKEETTTTMDVMMKEYAEMLGRDSGIILGLVANDSVKIEDSFKRK